MFGCRRGGRGPIVEILHIWWDSIWPVTPVTPVMALVPVRHHVVLRPPGLAKVASAATTRHGGKWVRGVLIRDYLVPVISGPSHVSANIALGITAMSLTSTAEERRRRGAISTGPEGRRVVLRGIHAGRCVRRRPKGVTSVWKFVATRRCASCSTKAGSLVTRRCGVGRFNLVVIVPILVNSAVFLAVLSGQVVFFTKRAGPGSGHP